MTAARSIAVAMLVAVLALPGPAPAIGRFDIKPVAVTFAPGVTSASVEITNDGAAAQELEIGVTTWSRSDGTDDGAPTDDIVASPSIFIVPPGGVQLVRLGPARDLSGDVERTYRLVATEVPDGASRQTVQTILRLRLPLFVTPRSVAGPPLVWRAERNAPNAVSVSTTNDGNVHRRIRALRITAGGRVVFDDVVAAYVLARQTRAWSVPLPAGVTTLDVRATEMDGAAVETSLHVR